MPKLGAERKLLLLLVRDGSLLTGVAELIEPEDFTNPAYREIYAAMKGSIGDAELDADRAWAKSLPGPLYERVQELAADPEELTNPVAVLDGVIARIRGRKIERRMSDLMTEMLVAEPGAQVELLSQIRKLRRDRTAIGGAIPGKRFYRGG